MAYESQQVSAEAGARLVAYRWPSAAPPRAALLVVHGMAEHARRYERFAEHLALRGIDMHAFDLRGHGATTRSVEHGFIGDDTRWETLLDDVERVRQRVSQTSGARVFLMGHSLGAFIALATLQSRGEHYAGAILSAPDVPSRLPCLAARVLARIEQARLEPSGTSDMLQQLIVGPFDRRLARRLGAVRPNAWLSSDEAAVAAYEADPNCGFPMRAGTWAQLLRGIMRSSSAPARRALPADLPLLLLSGSDDPMNRFARGAKRLARDLENDGQQDLELRIYEGLRHELLHEHAADTVSADIRDWVLDRAPAPARSRHTHAPDAF